MAIARSRRPQKLRREVIQRLPGCLSNFRLNRHSILPTLVQVGKTEAHLHKDDRQLKLSHEEQVLARRT